MNSKEKVEQWILLNPLIEIRQEELEKRKKKKIIQWDFRRIKYEDPTTIYKIRDVDFFLDKKRKRIYYRINKKKILVRILKKKTGNRWESFEITGVQFFYKWIFQKNKDQSFFYIYKK